MSKIINLSLEREKRKENSNIIDLKEYREKKGKSMSEEEFYERYMQNSVRSIYGDKGMSLVKEVIELKVD